MEANEEVRKLEAAVAALGGEKSAHAKPLLDALKMARAQSKVSPVRERMESFRKFIERAEARDEGRGTHLKGHRGSVPSGGRGAKNV